MHIVVNEMAGRLMVHRIDSFVVSIALITIFVFRLSTVPRVMEPERVIGTSALDEPLHCCDLPRHLNIHFSDESAGTHDICACRELSRMLRIVEEHYDVLCLESEPTCTYIQLKLM